MKNERWPHDCLVYREIPSGNPFDRKEKPDSLVIYRGKCRSYAKSTTSSSGEVITSTRVLSIPMNTFEWVDTPMEGDIVEVSIGNRKEYGKVFDFLPNNFGSKILWKYGRN